MSRFTGLQPRLARLLLAALLVLIVSGLALLMERPGGSGVPNAPERTDAALYRAIAARVAAGESYYPAVAAEHRNRHYPLRPFLTVRLPTLAEWTALISPDGAALALRLLSFVTLGAFLLRMRSEVRPGPTYAAAAALAAGGIVLLGLPAFAVWHEAWAALLICLSLACRSERRWTLSLALGLAAALTRELAVPYLLVMAFAAWSEGHRREAAAWAASVGAFALALAGHAWLLSGFVTAADAASPGWSRAGGWAFVLDMARNCTALTLLPALLAALLVPLSLFGWSAWRSPLGARGALLLCGYTAAFMIVGRADNFYWGLMIAPLLLVGLAFAPAGLRDLWRGATAPARRPQPA